MKNVRLCAAGPVTNYCWVLVEETASTPVGVYLMAVNKGRSTQPLGPLGPLAGVPPGRVSVVFPSSSPSASRSTHSCVCTTHHPGAALLKPSSVPHWALQRLCMKKVIHQNM